MAEITSIDVAHMNNGAHFLYMSNILARAEADNTVKTRAAAQVAALRTALAQEDADLKLSQKSLLTDKIAAADSERDALYYSYKKTVQGFLGLPVESMAEAATVLNQHLKDYAIDPKAQLDKETGLLVNLIADLEGKYATQVTALGLTAFVSNLKTANERVRTLTLQRTEQRLTVTVGALKASRAASDEAYRALVKMVNALALVEGETDYTAFIDYVNAEIVHYKREVLGQKATAMPAGGTTESGSPSSESGSGSESGGSDIEGI